MVANAAFIVTRTLEDDPVLRIGFERGLIGPGTLANHITKIHPELALNAESVRTTIRRLERQSPKQSTASKAKKVLAGSYLHMRSNMVKLEFTKDESTLQLINKSFRVNELYNNDLFRLIKGHSILHAVVEEVNLERIMQLFDGRIELIQKNMSEFIVVMPKESRDTPGILELLMGELGMNEINIVEAFSCGEEINIIVDEKDNQKAFNVITGLFKRCKAESA
jgi:aspartokinase